MVLSVVYIVEATGGGEEPVMKDVVDLHERPAGRRPEAQDGGERRRDKRGEAGLRHQVQGPGFGEPESQDTDREKGERDHPPRRAATSPHALSSARRVSLPPRGELQN